jgi:hypothetical protein
VLWPGPYPALKKATATCARETGFELAKAAAHDALGEQPGWCLLIPAAATQQHYSVGGRALSASVTLLEKSTNR